MHGRSREDCQAMELSSMKSQWKVWLWKLDTPVDRPEGEEGAHTTPDIYNICLHTHCVSTIVPCWDHCSLIADKAYKRLGSERLNPPPPPQSTNRQLRDRGWIHISCTMSAVQSLKIAIWIHLNTFLHLGRHVVRGLGPDFNRLDLLLVVLRSRTEYPPDTCIVDYHFESSIHSQKFVRLNILL